MFFLPIYADSHHPQEFLTAISGSQDEGEQIYSHFCATCHAQEPLVALGAPRRDDEIAWGLRLKQGIAALFQHADEGLNAMPPRGGCFECTDKQLMLAIVAMVPKQAKKDLLNQLRGHKKDSK
ncbi:MAG: c-type cytochrome [Legionellales bacterium]